MQKIISLISFLVLLVPVSVYAETSISAETIQAINITPNSARISADVTAGDASDNVFWFEWGISGDPNGTTIKSDEYTLDTKYTRTIGANLNGLAPSTQYFYRVVGENQKEHTTGSVIYFTTKPYEVAVGVPIVVNTLTTSSLKETSVVLHGYVAPHNESARSWFEWGTDAKLGKLTTDYYVNRNGGDIKASLQGIIPGTKYYYRVAAENDNSLVKGSILSFVTPGEKPVLESKNSQNVNTPLVAKIQPVSSSGENNKSSASDSVQKVAASTVKDVSVAVTPLGNGGAHQTIEYKVAYAYNRNDASRKAQLEVTLPSTLVYIGDTTANELLVKEAQDGGRTYILPIGTIKFGDTRSFSVIGMTTEGANGIPVVNAKLSFTTSDNQQLVAGVAMVGKNGSIFGNTSSGTTSSGTFPSTLVIWLIIINVIIASLIGAVKAKEWYQNAALSLKEAESKTEASVDEIPYKFEKEPLVLATTAVPVVEVKRPAINEFERDLEAVKGTPVDEFGLPGMYSVHEDVE